MTRADLIAALESAPGPDRGLGDQALLALGWLRSEVSWCAPDGTEYWEPDGGEHRDQYWEDRDRLVKMWRGLGITCFQVAEGDF